MHIKFYDHFLYVPFDCVYFRAHSIAILSVHLIQWKMCLKLITWNEINGIHTKWISFNTLHSSLVSVYIQISGLEVGSDAWCVAFNAFFTCLFPDWSTNLPNNKYFGLMTSPITTPFRFGAQIYTAFILSLQPPIEMDLRSSHLRGQSNMRVKSNCVWKNNSSQTDRYGE